MQIKVYMLSCPQREEMRNRSLANLEATDWGEAAIVEVDQTTHERLQQRQTETAFRLLQRAVEEGPPFFLFLEDDLDFNNNLRHNLEHWYPLTQIGPGGHFFASIYNPNVRALEQDEDKAFFIADPNSVYGSQAFVLSGATARHIVNNWESHIGMQDIKMSRLAAQVTPIYYHRPSLVQHIGVESAWGGSYHRTIDFQKHWKADAAPHGVSRPMILMQMRKTEGWLDDAEAKLLVDTVVTLTTGQQPCSIVEVGSYCGKSTVVFGLALKQMGEDGSRVFAIDPHDGRVSTLDGKIVSTGPTFDKFRKNILAAGVESLVEPILGRSTEIGWDRAIDLLFVDGLHGYDHVLADFRHFSPWIRPAGWVAFHDCAPHFPGVQRVVSEIVRSGEYQIAARANSLAVLKKAAA